MTKWTDPFALRADLAHIPMCNPTMTYKPIRYPWAEAFWQQQHQIHWMPEEINFGFDARDYALLPDNEKALLDNIFRLFTQADVDVADNYMTKTLPIFRDGSISRMLLAFASMETVHVKSYARILDTVGLPDSYHASYLEIAEMQAKHDLLRGVTLETPKDIAAMLALVGAFGEGLQLFSSFAMLMNFPRFGKMKGMGQVVSWSIRDETLHVQGITRLFHEFCREAGLSHADLHDRVLQGLHETVQLEDDFIDVIHQLGPVDGYTPEEMKAYVRFVGDARLRQLGYEPVFGIKKHPLPWLEIQINAIEHANFFETRSTEYSNGTSTGDWADSWDRFDRIMEKRDAMAA